MQFPQAHSRRKGLQGTITYREADWTGCREWTATKPTPLAEMVTGESYDAWRDYRSRESRSKSISRSLLRGQQATSITGAALRIADPLQLAPGSFDPYGFLWSCLYPGSGTTDENENQPKGATSPCVCSSRRYNSKINPDWEHLFRQCRDSAITSWKRTNRTDRRYQRGGILVEH